MEMDKLLRFREQQLVWFLASDPIGLERQTGASRSSTRDSGVLGKKGRREQSVLFLVEHRELADARFQPFGPTPGGRVVWRQNTSSHSLTTYFLQASQSASEG
jgi:hypothetical protein